MPRPREEVPACGATQLPATFQSAAISCERTECIAQLDGGHRNEEMAPQPADVSDEVRCDSAGAVSGDVRERLKRRRASTIHLLRGAAKGSTARSPAARALALQVRQGHNKGHARTGQQGRPTRLGDEAPSHRFRRQSLQRPTHGGPPAWRVDRSCRSGNLG
jgi:hypothetical protein